MNFFARLTGKFLGEQLDRAVRERDTVRRQEPEIEQRARRAEKRLADNGFAETFREALGGGS